MKTNVMQALHVEKLKMEQLNEDVRKPPNEGQCRDDVCREVRVEAVEEE
jgi:hypothetical protein